MDNLYISGFHTDAVKDPNKLYGWNKENGLLNSLTSDAINGRSFFLQGERRSGKTSLLQCLITSINNFYTSIIPVYIDCQRFTILNSPYGYVLSMMTEALLLRIDEGENWQGFDKILINGRNLEDIAYEEDDLPLRQCMRAYDKISNLLKNNHRQMLLIFDEYEYFTHCGNGNNSFTPFRSLMDKYSKDDGGIFCIISGAEDLSDFSVRTGSPQFNLFTKENLVPPLEQNDFFELWKDCRAGCSDLSKELLDKCCPGIYCKDLTTLYNMCGGRPSFAKLLGEFWSQDEKTDPLSIVFRWMNDIFERQTESRKKILIDIVSNKPTQSNKDTLYLEKMYLIKRNIDKEIGGFSICGQLWMKYLLSRTIEYKPEIRHAGDLANLIIERDKLKKLLRTRYKHGEKDDWLEFKAALIPNIKQKELDRKKSKKQFTNDDYIWHVVKAIIAMRNTRGGLLLIGVNDDASIVGVDTKGLSDGDFIRNYFINRINKHLLCLCDKKINLINCNWDFSNMPDWISCGIAEIDEKKIIYVCINPVLPSIIEDYFIVESDLSNRRSYKFLIVRSNQENIEISIDDNFKNIKNHFQIMENNKEKSVELLLKFWNLLID